VLGAPELDAGLLGGLSRAEQRGRIPPLALLATLLGMQPGVRLSFWAACARWWLMSSISYTNTQSVFECVVDSNNLEECVHTLSYSGIFPCSDVL